MDKAQAHDPLKMPSLVALWTGILAGPVVMLLQQQAGFVLTPAACAFGWTPLLHVITLISLVLVAAAGWLAWKKWKELGRELPGDRGDVVSRSRFLAASGAGLSALFFLVILAQGLATVVLNPCD